VTRAEGGGGTVRVGPGGLCRREHGCLVGALILYTGDCELALEIAQEALASACLDCARVSEMAAPGAWVHGVAINLTNRGFRRAGLERGPGIGFRSLEKPGAACGNG
jgi:DNA-directed RNA polymerase specialized sigma24 family protein